MVEGVFRRTAIRLRWAPWRVRIALIALWLFYRTLNLIGFHRANKDHADLSGEFLPVVEAFDALGDTMSVYNFQADDGRTVTVLIAKVSVGGPLNGGHV